MGRNALPLTPWGVAAPQGGRVAAVAAAARDDRAFDRALAELADGHVVAAFEALGRLADADDARAARIALMLERHATGLYGARVAAAPARRVHWQAVAAHEA